MAKKQTRRSISVSGETYNAVRDYCDVHGLSASGLVTELLARYLVDNEGGPPPGAATEESAEKPEPPVAEPPAPEAPKAQRPRTPSATLGTPQPLKDANFPDRRGPSFSPLADDVPGWVVTAQIEISRRREIDAESAVEVLLMNLVHRRMVNEARMVKIESKKD